MLEDITIKWDRKFDNHSNAKPEPEERYVVDVLAIRMKNGHLRGSDFDGVFELADTPKPFDVRSAELRVEVKVGWFGMKPKTSWSHITLRKDWELIRNYTGNVVHNLSYVITS
jgi:hypothetical protein